MTSFGDRFLGLALFVLAVSYGWVAQQWPPPFGGHEAVGPETFPTILAFILAGSSLYLMFKPDPDAHWPVGRTAAELVGAMVILVLYAFVLETLGFVIATTLAVGTLCWRMGAKPRASFLVGVISAVSVFLLFNNLLELSLPGGLLEFD